MPQDQTTLTFPLTRIMVGKDGILIETFLDATTSIRKVLTEKESNDMVRVWIEGRKQLKSQLQLVEDVMRKKLH